MIVGNFYEAAFLLYKNRVFTKIEKNEKGRKLYHFIDEDGSIKEDIAEFHNNQVLKEFISSIVILRNIDKTYYRKWDSEKSADTANIVSPVEV